MTYRGGRSIPCDILGNPVTVTTGGTSKVGTVQYDTRGVEVISLKTAFGDTLVAELHPQWQQSFEYTVNNTALNINTIVGTGTVTQANAMATVTTGTTAGSKARLQSAHHAKYKAALGGSARFSARFTSGVAGTTQYVGVVDEYGSTATFKNGFTIGYNGVLPTLVRFSNDTFNEIPRTDWDDKLDGTGISGVILDFTNLNVFYIQYQYLGAGNIFFYVENPTTGVPFLFHTLRYANLNITPSTFNPNYHMTLYVDNGGTTNSVSVYCGSYGFFTEGLTELIEIHQPQFSSGNQTKAAVTTEIALFTIKNKLTYPTAAPKTNYIDLILERISCAIEANAANNLGNIRLVKNATLGGTPSYTDIQATNSVCSIDVAGTTVTGGTQIIVLHLANKNDKEYENLLPYKVIIHPGETVTIAGTSANSATINSALLWKELF